MRVQLLTEGAIRAALLEQLGGAARGDSLDMALYQLADRDVVRGAAGRRAPRRHRAPDPRPERGRARRSPPRACPTSRWRASWSRAAAGRSTCAGTARTASAFTARWRCWSTAQRLWLTLGSANFTRRSLDDYDLEANVALELTADAAIAEQARGYFETLWGNRAGAGIEYTADFAAFADPSQADYWLGRLLEATGLSGF